MDKRFYLLTMFVAFIVFSFANAASAALQIRQQQTTYGSNYESSYFDPAGYYTWAQSFQNTNFFLSGVSLPLTKNTSNPPGNFYIRLFDNWNGQPDGVPNNAIASIEIPANSLPSTNSGFLRFDFPNDVIVNQAKYWIVVSYGDPSGWPNAINWWRADSNVYPDGVGLDVGHNAYHSEWDFAFKAFWTRRPYASGASTNHPNPYQPGENVDYTINWQYDGTPTPESVIAKICPTNALNASYECSDGPAICTAPPSTPALSGTSYCSAPAPSETATYYIFAYDQDGSKMSRPIEIQIQQTPVEQKMLSLMNAYWPIDFYDEYYTGPDNACPGSSPLKDDINNVDTNDLWMINYPVVIGINKDGHFLTLDGNRWYSSPAEIDISQDIVFDQPELKKSLDKSFILQKILDTLELSIEANSYAQKPSAHPSDPQKALSDVINNVWFNSPAASAGTTDIYKYVYDEPTNTIYPDLLDNQLNLFLDPTSKLLDWFTYDYEKTHDILVDIDPIAHGLKVGEYTFSLDTDLSLQVGVGEKISPATIPGVTGTILGAEINIDANGGLYVDLLDFVEGSGNVGLQNPIQLTHEALMPLAAIYRGECINSLFKDGAKYCGLKTLQPAFMFDWTDAIAEVSASLDVDFMGLQYHPTFNEHLDLLKAPQKPVVIGNAKIVLHSPVSATGYDSYGNLLFGDGRSGSNEIYTVASNIPRFVVDLKGEADATYGLEVSRPATFYDANGEVFATTLDYQLTDMQTRLGQSDYLDFDFEKLGKQIQETITAEGAVGDDAVTIAMDMASNWDLDQDSSHQPDVNQSDLIFNKRVAILEAKASDVKPNELFTLETSLVDLGQKLVDREVSLALDGNTIETKRTDSQGKATFSFNTTDGSAPHIVTLSSPADSTYDPANKVVELTVINSKPTIEVLSPSNFSTVGGIVQIDANIQDSNLQGMEVYVGKVNGSTADKNLVATQLPFSWDTNVLPKGVYVVEIKATDTWAETTYASVLVNVVLGAPTLNKPKQNYVVLGSNPTLFSWNSVSEATRYKLTIHHPTAGDVFTAYTTNTQYNVDLSGLANGKYTWWINAIDTNNNPGLDSEKRSFTKMIATGIKLPGTALNPIQP